MADLLNECTRTSRGKVLCNVHNGNIPAGEKYREKFLAEYGQIWRFRVCQYCRDIFAAWEDLDDAFPGEFEPEWMIDFAEEMIYTGSKCAKVCADWLTRFSPDETQQ